MDNEVTLEPNQEAKKELFSNSIVPKAVLSALREDFPKEAIETVIKDNDFEQTGVKPAWVIERLNEVLGVEGWDTEELEIKESGTDIATKIRLNMYMIVDSNNALNKVLVATRIQWGSARKKGRQEYGDALKSAHTNGLCKCASMFDIAHKAYKGQLIPVEPRKENIVVDVEEAKAYDAAAQVEKQEMPRRRELSATEPDIRAARKKLRDVAAAKRITRNQVQEVSEKEFGKAQSKDLTLEELSQLIDIFERWDVNAVNAENGEGYPA